MGAIGDVIGGVFNAVGSLFGGGNQPDTSDYNAALAQQAKAQEEALKMQREQQERNRALQDQANKQANAQRVYASQRASNNAPTSANPSNLTGGLGVDPGSLSLGANSLLGSDDKKTFL